MTYNVIDIANKILAKASISEFEDLICNLKLQKMLYYMQGFHLAYFEKPLFDDEIEAWMYGPVIPKVYETFKSNGNSGIKFTGEVINLTEKEESLFNEVYRVYGAYSAVGLMNLTHSEMPWKSTPTGIGSIIGKDKMMTYFKKRLK
jgi:uncharacterized phage-associated protein